MPEGSSSVVASPTFAYAKTGIRTAKTRSASSVLRRLGAPTDVMVVVLVTTLMLD